MTQPATRLITLILLLQNQPNQKAAELAGKLGILARNTHDIYLNHVRKAKPENL